MSCAGDGRRRRLRDGVGFTMGSEPLDRANDDVGRGAIGVAHGNLVADGDRSEHVGNGLAVAGDFAVGPHRTDFKAATSGTEMRLSVDLIETAWARLGVRGQRKNLTRRIEVMLNGAQPPARLAQVPVTRSSRRRPWTTRHATIALTPRAAAPVSSMAWWPIWAGHPVPSRLPCSGSGLPRPV